jgi:hypothetical protein
MLDIAPDAATRLDPEVHEALERFVTALPAMAARRLRHVSLFGAQARQWDPAARFDLLVVADDRTVETRTALDLATRALEDDGRITADVTLASAFEVSQPTGLLRRLLDLARREEVVLWRRAEAA